MTQKEQRPNTANIDEMPDSGYLRERQLLAIGVLPFSKYTLWRKVREGKFPAPVKLSEAITAWRVGDVRGWLRSPVL